MYKAFSTFVLRTPNFPIEKLECGCFDAIIRDPMFQEAIYIASPILYNEMQKLLNKEVIPEKKKNRIENALYRYFSRMSTRCTPFGLFSSISVGKIEYSSKILLESYKFSFRLDMQVLYHIYVKLLEISEIKYRIKYYPNTSLYKLGNTFRYVECINVENNFEYQFVSLKSTKILDKILGLAKKGVTIEDVINYLLMFDFEKDSILEYVDDLIKSQVLISGLYPSTVGENYFNRIIDVLKELNIPRIYMDKLLKIKKTFLQLENQTDSLSRIQSYEKIKSITRELGVNCEINNYIQADIFGKDKISKLNISVVDELNRVMKFLNKVNPVSGGNKFINQFKKVFYERYEEQEVPLVEVLDPEIGIGYPIGVNSFFKSPLLKEFYIENQNEDNEAISVDDFTKILLNKVLDSYRFNNIEIVLSDNDFINDNNDNWNDLSPTFFAMFNLFKANCDNPLIHLHGFFGSSGAKTFTRFMHIDESVERIVNDIVRKEEEIFNDKILAEIIHLPNPKMGNVITHNHIRKFEIPYLSYSSKSSDGIILISDILVSLNRERIVLKSKKMKKEIIPILTNAHNYSVNTSVPIYRFLSDLQSQYSRNLFFDWGYLKKELSFFPRVRYENTILSLATWMIKIKEIEWMFSINDDVMTKEINEWRKNMKLPRMVILVDYDNELFVDWYNQRSIKAFLSAVKRFSVITLSEFIHDENLLVKDLNGNHFANEFIIPFYKDINYDK